jgi:hypothetical protein
MDYDANVDDAVMEAVLGPQRNSLRNTRPTEAEAAERPDATNGCQERSFDRS